LSEKEEQSWKHAQTLQAKFRTNTQGLEKERRKKQKLKSKLL
jgi:hypothetical protein